MSKWLDGRVAVVTGASRGIGAGTAIELARAGASVVACARSGGALQELAEKIEADGGSAIAVEADVSREEDVERVFNEAEQIGPPAVLVCSAGVLEKKPIEETTAEMWRRTIDINLTGTFLCCRRAFAAMRTAGGGRIVTLSSLSGVYATEKFPGLTAYNVSKYGIVGLTEMIAVEGRDYDISAVCLSLGAVDTEMLRAAAPHLKPALGPRDVGRMIVALLDEDLASLSGANIPVFSNR